MTIEQAIEHAEKVAGEKLKNAEFIKNNPYGDKSKIQGCIECAAEHRQLAAWLRELAERRKAPEIVRCGECVNFAERDFCEVAGHNVHRKSNCMQVFGAERRTDGKNLSE